MRHCKRPCHDCPFRTDIIPYQSQDDIERNLRTLDGPKTASCHHRAIANGTAHKENEEVMCGGFLATLTAWGERPDLPRVHYPNVFRDRQHFLEGAIAKSQTFMYRWFAWLCIQPPQKQIRELLYRYGTR